MRGELSTVTNISSFLVCELRLQQLRSDASKNEAQWRVPKPRRGSEVREMGAQTCTTRTPNLAPRAGHVPVLGEYLNKVNTLLFPSYTVQAGSSLFTQLLKRNRWQETDVKALVHNLPAPLTKKVSPHPQSIGLQTIAQIHGQCKKNRNFLAN